MSQSSDDYEHFVKKVVEELSCVEVFHQKVYTGKVSGRDIKVDVSFELSTLGGAKSLYLVECKCYSHRVPVDDVEEFHSKKDDIGAHKGIMITTIGFQEGAVKTARGRGIALALLTKEPQAGELRYIVNSAAPPPERVRKSNALLQGNFKGFFDDYEGGVRFESFGQLIGILVIQARNDERENR